VLLLSEAGTPEKRLSGLAASTECSGGGTPRGNGIGKRQRPRSGRGDRGQEALNPWRGGATLAGAGRTGGVAQALGEVKQTSSQPVRREVTSDQSPSGVQTVETASKRALFAREKEPWCGLEVISEGEGRSASVTSVLNPCAEEFVPEGGASIGIGKVEKEATQPKVAASERKRIGPTVAGAVDGVSVKFLVDSGAEGTILSQRCFATLPKSARSKFLDGTGSITVADGSSLPCRGPALCNITVGGKTVTDLVFVADIEDFALLGWDAQLELGVLYQVAGVDVVTPPVVRRVFNPVVRRVCLSRDFVVPPRSEVLVTGIVEGGLNDGEVLVSQREDTTDPGMAVARTLVRVCRGVCPVRLLNPTEVPISLREKDVIAGAEVVDEVSAGPLSDDTAASELPAHLTELYTKAVVEANLPDVIAEQLKKLLIKHGNVFASSDDDLGRTTLVEHHIDTGDAAPIRQPARRLPLSQQADCEKEIESMLAKGVIEPGQSPWASPIVLVRKKDGSLRFCVDYRRLNNVTKFDAYPLPRIDETLEALGGAKWFTTLDLISGYWQVGLTPEAKLKSAFCVRSGLYLWRVMPFGLCNAPSTFERLMETVLQGLQWNSCLYTSMTSSFSGQPRLS
jgi:hypothetical protein